MPSGFDPAFGRGSSLNSQPPTPSFTFRPYRLGCLGAVILMPLAADQFGSFAYLGILLLAVPLLLLERKPNLLKTFAVLALAAFLSLSTVLIFGLSDFGRLALAIEFLFLAFLFPRT